ncbi:hypothetical protein TRAPUB_13906 [Trametes pubescens]|uniref:Secretory component protein SHR3 n=1 Tax=Trametes pubescens TaxID=154538 RepID=A0A1M2VPY5_TRAPU|nr:hypothetical protein TRAPUB_13906 [Trametes pubescens]
MGYRQAAVLTSVSFFLGVLFICLNVDYRILFTPLTESVVRDGLEFYTMFYNSPPAIKASICALPPAVRPAHSRSRSLALPFARPPTPPAPTPTYVLDTQGLLHSIVGVGLLGLLGKLHKWDDSAMFFDGSSLAAYIFSLAVYMTVGIPACRTVADPLPDVDSQEDRVEALRILSAGNTIIIVLLGAILALQASRAGEQYARRVEENLIQQAAEQEKAKPAAAAETETKKDK